MAWTNVQWGTVCIEAASDDVPETVANLLVKSEDCDRWKLSSVKLMKSRRNDVVTLNMEGLPYGRCDRSIYSPAGSVTWHWLNPCRQKTQLSQRDRSMLCVIEYFAKSLKITQGHSKWRLEKGVRGGPRPNGHTLWHRETNGVVWGYV